MMKGKELFHTHKNEEEKKYMNFQIWKKNLLKSIELVSCL